MPEPGSDGQSLLIEVEPVAGVVVEPKAAVVKTFRCYDQDQPMLLPVDLREWLPAGHPARMVDDLVEHGLDLAGVYADDTEVRGAPPYDPRLMVKVLVYGYSHGITSSRALERRCHDDIAFRFLTAQAAPDFVAIARFRTRHGAASQALFTQSLALCARAGLLRLGRVALDGTKVRASASRHRAMSYERMLRTEGELAEQVAGLLAEAAVVDAAEDAAYGPGRRADELPAELARRTDRLAVIRKARQALEAEHAAAQNPVPPAAETGIVPAAETGIVPVGEAGIVPVGEAGIVPVGEAGIVPVGEAGIVPVGGTGIGVVPAVPAPRAGLVPVVAVVPGKAQRSFTDPDARIMKTSDGSFQYCYNGQVIADERSQVVLAWRIGQSGADCPALPGMLTELDTVLTAAGITARPKTLLADAGYFSAANVEAALAAGIDPLIATGRLKHGDSPPSAPRGRIPAGLTPKQLMARKLRTKQGKAGYARRKAIVEPVFGQLEVAQTGDRLRLRGKTNADHEYGFHLACHNFRKLFNSGWTPTAVT
jgi:transposase